MKCIHEIEYGICEIDYDLCHNGLCRIKEPQTNADRIRAMSDEELAEWMATKTSCMKCPVDLDACYNFEFSGEMSCKEILLDWLKSREEEEQT